MIFAILLDIASYVLAAMLIMVCGAWITLLKSMSASFRHTPYLDGFEKKSYAAGTAPKVSVILPARNEQKYIARCLDSLLKQDYQNYEIIAINDSSDDDTAEIIKQYASKNSKIVYVDAKQKPAGWMGKNWACVEGYKKSTGELLLFTDSDTTHSPPVISLAVGHLSASRLDALTVMPNILSLDFWTRITLPMISVFLHTRFSALRVNDPTQNTGYFFGSFFIIKRQTYDSVGTHSGVKHEIIEDGALGKKVKESGHSMKMVRGEHLIDAVWARDRKTLWNALKRLMVPLYIQNPAIAIGIFFAVLFLLFMPFVLLAYSLAMFDGRLPSSVLLVSAAAAASTLVYIGAFAETSRGVHIALRYAVLAPVGGLVVIAGFLSGLVHAKSSTAISWRGRTYSINDNHTQKGINL